MSAKKSPAKRRRTESHTSVALDSGTLMEEALARQRAVAALREADSELDLMAKRAVEAREAAEAQMAIEMSAMETAQARALALARKKTEEVQAEAAIELRMVRNDCNRQIEQEHARAEEATRTMRALHARELDSAKRALEAARAQAAAEMKELRANHDTKVAELIADHDATVHQLHDEHRRESEKLRMEHALLQRRQREHAARELSSVLLKLEIESKKLREAEGLLQTLRVDMISRARDHALAVEARATRAHEAAAQADVHATSQEKLAENAREMSDRANELALREEDNSKIAVDNLRKLENEFRDLIGASETAAPSEQETEDEPSKKEEDMTEEEKLHKLRRSMRIARSHGKNMTKAEHEWLEEMMAIEKEVEMAEN